MAIFLSPSQNHEHSCETLNVLNQYQDFMDGIKTVADMGCGAGLDASWWANLTSDNGVPRNIKVHAIDINLQGQSIIHHPNISYINTEYSNTGIAKESVDLIWAHDSLQYSLNPLATLLHWWDLLRDDGMLIVTLPYNFTVNTHLDIAKVDATYTMGCYQNYTLSSLIMHLAATGFDCRNSHFKIDRTRGWLHAAVYKLPTSPNPYMNWYEMCERQLLLPSIEQEIFRKGSFNDTDIVCEWIDRSQYMLRVN